ncbi:MAG: protein-glutamate O-methyltransferase CheR [Terracidiphilus sp.]
MTAAIENSIYPMGLREFKAFRSLIHEHTGIWLRDGKQVMLASRLSRRLRYHGMADFAEYYRYVQRVPDDSEEIRELINCVTTNKTSFFRERHHFEFLANTVVPEVRTAIPSGAPRSIRIWSAASSTGEEPYTIAITLLEAMQTQRRFNLQQGSAAHAGHPGFTVAPGSWKIEVVASDIDTKVLDTARHAIYSEESLVAVAPPLKKKYFLRGKDEMTGQVKVKPEVARLVQFKRINLKDARWPLEGLFDAIFFRNALIYFNQNTQDIFLRKMVRYLKPRGYLFLGNAEHIPWLQDILEPLNQTMYRLRPSQ